jgi:hypothetical protein
MKLAIEINIKENMAFEFLRPFKVAKERVGRNWDGGYVLESNSLAQVEVVYSYGVGWELSFEKALYERTHKTIRLFDPTLFDMGNIPIQSKRGLYWLGRYFAKVVYFKSILLSLPLRGYGLRFYNEGIAKSKNGKYNSFTNHLAEFGDEGKKVLLKMDIEGGEYEMFEDEKFQKSLNNVVQIAMELHDLETELPRVEKMVKRLADRFSVVHFHANNYGYLFEARGKKVPSVIELTFLNNAYLPQRIVDTAKLPVPGLDYPNNMALPDMELSHLFD